jgi:MFS transporter, DHA1 family, tetracycline resistance protein
MPPRKASLLVIFLTVFIDLLGFGIVVPLLPVYAAEFKVDEHGIELGLLMASFSAMQFLFAPWWGRLSDRIGRRPVLIIGLIGSTFFYAMFGLATVWRSMTWLFITRLGAGIAGATISTTQAYIADVTTLETRQKGMALIGAAFGLGFTFGPLLAAAAVWSSGDSDLTPAPGFAASALSGLALLLAIFYLPESLQAGGAPQHRRKVFDFEALGMALSIPSIGVLLLATFLSILSFGGFETTLALLLSEKTGVFGFRLYAVSLYFAYIGLVLSFAQGFLVRRLSGRVSEAPMATAGVIVSIVGFACLALATQLANLPFMFIATAIEVTGFALMTPSLNSLISRRSDPAKQGSILGLAQSIGSLARIVGPAVAIPLFKIESALPYWSAVGLLVAALIVVRIAARSGKDFAGASEAPAPLEPDLTH